MIDDGSELFGNATPMAAGYQAAHGYVALAEVDESAGGNFDGRINADDALFAELCVWLDENHNGFSEPGEIFSLEEAGVVEIDLRFRYSLRRDQLGNYFRYLGDAWILRDGRLHKVKTTDVFFVGYE